MIYIPQLNQEKKAINLIKEVLFAHIKMKEEKEKLILESFSSEKIFKSDDSSLEESLREIELIDAKIQAIKYTFDYVKLMTSR